MKLAVFSPVFGNRSLEEALRYLSAKGVDGLELGAGGYPGKAHADILELKSDSRKIAELKALFDKYNLEICALSRTRKRRASSKGDREDRHRGIGSSH